jgi:CheY-like chemotaxis protein
MNKYVKEKARILLVEDNEANLLMTQDYLESYGYQVISARDGDEALTMMDENPPDLVLMDIQMPGMDGFEVLRRIRLQPRFASVPIIALTALAMPGDRERCLEAGANEYLSKPVELKFLLYAIEKFTDDLSGGD